MLKQFYYVCYYVEKTRNGCPGLFFHIFEAKSPKHACLVFKNEHPGFKAEIREVKLYHEIRI